MRAVLQIKLLLIPLAGVAMLALLTLGRWIGGYGARPWALAWALLALSSWLTLEGGLALIPANALGVFFMPLVLAGALEYRQRPPLRWLFPATFGWALVRAAITAAGLLPAAYALQAPIELGLGLAAVIHTARSPGPRDALSHALLPAALAATAAIDVTDLAFRVLERPEVLVITAWAACAVVLILVQILALIGRLRVREGEVVRDRDRLSDIVARTSDSVAIADRTGLLVYLNEAGRRMVGVDPEGDVGRLTVAQLVPPGDLARLREDVLPRASRLGVVETEISVVRQDDGRRIPVSQVVIPQRDAAGSVTHFATVFRDLSARQAVEEERRNLRAVLETAPVGVFLIDGDLRIRMLNALGASHFGLGDPARWQGRTVHEGYEAIRDSLADPPWVLGQLEALVDDPGLVLDSLELRLTRPEERTLTVFSAPLRGAAGDFAGRVVTSRDVTAEQRLETELRQAHKMETLGTLAGGVAHDFNNQLTAILGNAQLALDALPEDGEASAALRDLETAAEHCARLTRSLLAFARRTPVEPRAIDPRRVLGEVERMLRATLPSSIHLEVRSEPELPPVLADETQLQQILLNLGVNARDAIAGEGRVRLRARPREVDGAEAGRTGDRAPGSYVEFEVRDDGVGMDAHTRARIFDPFFTTKPHGAGTGLGLAVVYGLARVHEGFVELESEVGKGTTFRVALPAGQDAAGAEAQPDAEAAVGGPELILVADDEPAIRRLARGTLERLGYRVVEAADGVEALETFRVLASDVALVLLDLTMPRMDGRRTLAAIREIDPHARVLMASGHFTDEPEDLGVALLPKPWTPERLATRVRAELDAPRDGPGTRGA